MKKGKSFKTRLCKRRNCTAPEREKKQRLINQRDDVDPWHWFFLPMQNRPEIKFWDAKESHWVTLNYTEWKYLLKSTLWLLKYFHVNKVNDTCCLCVSLLDDQQCEKSLNSIAVNVLINANKIINRRHECSVPWINRLTAQQSN